MATLIALGIAWSVGDALYWGGYDPVYRGRRLSSWLEDRDPRKEGPTTLRDDSVRAVRAIGPAAIPSLLVWLKAPSSAASPRFDPAIDRLIFSQRRNSFNIEMRIRALHAFRALGLAAKPAFPGLADLALYSPDPGTRDAAINSLTESDRETIARIARELDSQDREIRLRTVHALNGLRHDPQVSVPTLVRAMKDVDNEVRFMAASALIRYPYNNPDARPVLEELARDVGPIGPAARSTLDTIRRQIDAEKNWLRSRPGV